MTLLNADFLKILDYVENFDEKGIQLAILGTIGRSGSVLYHSLLDDHPQILQIPVHFYYYSDWEGLLKYSAPDTLLDDFFTKSMSFYGEIPKLGPERNITLDLQFDKIREIMRSLLPYLSSVSRKKFLLLFHFVYAHVFQIDLKPVKVLLLHNHSMPTIFGYFVYALLQGHYLTDEDIEPFFELTPSQYANTIDYFFENALRDFPNLKLLGTLRDPMSIIYSTGGYVPGGNKLAPELSIHYWTSYHMPLLYASLYGLKKKMGERFHMVKFEDIHCHTERVMQETASFLGIDFQDSLLSSTFGGLLWSGSIVTDKVLFGTNPNIVEEDRSKWQTHWDAHTQAFFALICNPLARVFGYEPYNISSDGLDLEKFIPHELKTYRDYPLFLSINCHNNIAELRKLHESGEVPQNEYYLQVANHYDLLEKRIQFWKAYPGMRKKALACFQKTGAELNHLEPLS